MTCAIDIRDDPGQPPGGHAIVLFRDVMRDGTTAVLAIESLTEGFDYRGPRRLECPAKATSSGLEVRIGPDVVGALKEGLAVNLSLAGTTIGADVLWPVLTPMRVAPRRRALPAAQPRRIVVDGKDGAAQTAVDRTFETGPSKGAEPADQPPRRPETTPPQTDLTVLTPAEKAASETPDIPQEGAAGAGHDGTIPPSSQIQTKAEPQGRPQERPQSQAQERPEAQTHIRPQGWQPKAVAAVALLAFVVGAGATGLAWLMTPAPRLVAPTGDLTLPSPYLMLGDLADRSPNGIAVDVGDPAALRRRGDVATSAPEASFWRKWAARKLLDSQTNDAAAILSDFATDLATQHTAKPDLAAARFVWEMAAIAKDCAAMDNIATAFDVARTAPDAAATWRQRAQSCRGEKSPGP